MGHSKAGVDIGSKDTASINMLKILGTVWDSTFFAVHQAVFPSPLYMCFFLWSSALPGWIRSHLPSLKAGFDPPFTAFPPSSKTKTCASPTVDEKESGVATAEANTHLNVWAVPNSSFLPFQRNMVKGYNDGKDRTHQGI